MMNKVLDGEVFDVDEYISTHESSKETMDPLNNKTAQVHQLQVKLPTQPKLIPRIKLQAQLQM